MIKFRQTSRGFQRGEFHDRYGQACSIQESSLASEPAIWLGCEHEQVTAADGPIGARMHLTQAAAKELAECLLAFAATGYLCRSDTKE